MFIKELKIRNFQQIESLDIKFINGVNFVVGRSGAGKSTVLRAISFLVKNEPHSLDVIRPDKISDTKRAPATSVTGIFDNNVEVEHVKSASINRFIVRKNGEEIIYDACGVQIPEDVQKILQHTSLVIDKEELDLNFAEQISLPFLYDKSGSFRLKLFNRLTGADLIDKLVQLMNKEILSFGRDIKTEQEFVDLNEPKLKEVTQQVEEKQKVYGKVKFIYDAVKAKILTLQILKTLESSVKTSNTSISSVTKALQGVKFVPEEAITAFKSQIDSYVALKQIQGSYWALNEDLLHVQSALSSIVEVSQETVIKLRELIDRHFILDDLQGAINDNKKNLERVQVETLSVKMVDVDTSLLRDKITKLSAMQLIKKQISDSFDKIQQTILQINDTTGNIKNLDQQYKDILIDAKFCPVCKRSTCEVHS